jgi:hypothetical protein
VELTRRQRNDIFEALQAKGVDPADCELSEYAQASARVFRTAIRHPPTKSIFLLNMQGSEYRFRWGVPDGLSSGPSVDRCNSWLGVIGQIRHWADEVAYVAKHPDLWAELQQVPEVMATAQAAGASNAPFTADEQAEISNRLDEVKQLVREQFELTDEQLAAIDQRLDDAEEAARHSDRKTWLYTFYGAVMSTFMTDEIPPQVIQTVVSTVLHGIAHIFGIGGAPPVIGT